MGWLRDYLWLNSSQQLNGYNPFGMNSLSVWAWMFLFGHIWHGARILFRGVFAGSDPDFQVYKKTFLQKIFSLLLHKALHYINNHICLLLEL